MFIGSSLLILPSLNKYTIDRFYLVHFKISIKHNNELMMFWWAAFFLRCWTQTSAVVSVFPSVNHTTETSVVDARMSESDTKRGTKRRVCSSASVSEKRKTNEKKKLCDQIVCMYLYIIYISWNINHYRVFNWIS